MEVSMKDIGEKLGLMTDGNSSTPTRDYGQALLNAAGGWLLVDIASDHQEGAERAFRTVGRRTSPDEPGQASSET